MRVGNAQEVLGVIRLACRTPQSYRRVILCAPFISANFLRTRLGRRSMACVPSVIITRSETVPLVLKELQSWRGHFAVGSIPNLHAKVYLACGRDEVDSVAVIGSFNLTVAALDTNVEFGVRFAGDTPERRRAIKVLETKLMRMAEFVPSE
jgi:hypothetical protein